MVENNDRTGLAGFADRPYFTEATNTETWSCSGLNGVDTESSTG